MNAFPDHAGNSYIAALPPPLSLGQWVMKMNSLPDHHESERGLSHQERYLRTLRLRSHQLPSVIVCPVHAEPLRHSTVDREERKARYQAATDGACPQGAPRVVEVDDPRLADLLDLARHSDFLLDGRSGLCPDDRREEYLVRLQAMRMLNVAGEAKLPAIARSMDVWWGRTLDRWPGLARDGMCQQGWLGALLVGGHGSPPLHHLLLEGMLDRAERWT
ncbi:MAG: hypothetical protein M3R41_00225 [Pseudomonadota bacterium]|nr:hypothetical protein [Pseudomonadota bacterium]